MESHLSQRLSMNVTVPSQSQSVSPSQDITDWLEPSEEFPILFGLLTAHANAQQKSKEKQIRRRILRLNRNPAAPSSVRNLIMEPDSSFRESDSDNSQVPIIGCDDRSCQNLNPSSSASVSVVPASGGGLIMGRKPRKNKLEESYEDDDDAIPTSTTDDYDIVVNMTTSDESECESEGGTNYENEKRISRSERISISDNSPPRKRSRLEECLMPRLEVMISHGGQGESYHRQKNNNIRQKNDDDRKKNTPIQDFQNKLKVQETSITTNSENSIYPEHSIPTLNLRELLASQDIKSPLFGESDTNIWKAHEFRFEKRKYTRRYRNPETNDLIQVVDEEERPFQCTQCDLKFKRSYHLTRHATIHCREEKFFCPSCKTACFQRKDNLLAHMRKCCPPPSSPPEESTSLLHRQLMLGSCRPNPKIYPKSFRTNDPPSSTNSSNNFNSWICLSKFMETAGAEEIEQEEDDIDEKIVVANAPLLGIDLDMVEITEVSPEEPSSYYEECSNFSTKNTQLDIGTKHKRVWSQNNNNNNISSSPLPQSLFTENEKQNLGVNLCVTKESCDKEKKYPCGDCNAVFRSLNRLMKHSTTIHVTSEEPSTNKFQDLQFQIE